MYAVPLRSFFIAFALGLAALVVLFGGNFPLAQGAMPIFCAVLLAISVATPLRKPATVANRWLLAGVWMPVGVVLAWAALQIAPLSGSFVVASPYWSLIDNPVWTTLSLSPGATLAQLGVGVGYAAAAFALYRVGQTHPAPLLRITAVIITLAAAYGIVIFAAGNHSVLWLAKTSYTDSLSATFINRNSFATLAGLGVLANMGLALQRIGEISRRLDTRQRWRAFLLLVIQPGWPWMLAALVCFMALVLTNSRAGLTAGVCGLVVLLGSLAGMRAAARWPLVAMITLLVTASGIILAAVGNTLGSRLAHVAADSDLRQAIYNLTGDLIGHSPLTGSGFGTYAQAFSTVRTAPFLYSFPNAVDHAHNTYLELLAELGYPALLLGITLLCLLAACLNGLRVRRRAIIWPALGMSAIVLVGGHAFADFSLSIPAVTLATFAILMPALAQSMPVKESEKTAAPTKRGLLTVLPAAVAILAFSGWQTAANYQAHRAEGTLRALLHGESVSRSDIFTAQRHATRCLNINPYHPTCGFGLAQTSLSLATGYGLTGNNRGVALVYLNLAQHQYEAALAKSPVNPLAWYRLARINAYLGNTQVAVDDLANSLLTGPAEPIVAHQRIPLMMSLLNKTDAENAALFKENMLKIWQSTHWQVGQEVRANPSIQADFAHIIAGEPKAPIWWQMHMGTPFPIPNVRENPLGAAPENR